MYPNVIEVKFNKNPLGIDEKTGQWQPNWTFEDMKMADVVMTQNIVNWGGNYSARICGKAKEFGKIFHYDNDDLLTELYEGHRLHGVYKEKQLDEITKFIYNSSDLVTVTQVKFLKRVQEYCGGILAVVKNAIDYQLPCWNQPKVITRRKNFVRIGWAGGIHHEEDVKEFAGIPHMVNQRVGRENVVWNFYGCPPLYCEACKTVGTAKCPKCGKQLRDWQHDVWDNYKAILLRGFKGGKNWNVFNAMPADQYGAMFAAMDISIAPLQMNNFNDSKSDIKVSESGRYSVPLIASNVGCYDETIENGKTGYLIDPGANKTEWVKVLTKTIKDKKHRETMGSNLHSITERQFDLNKVVHGRLDLYEELFKHKGLL